MDLKKHIRAIPDWPKKGIIFRDITTLIQNPEALHHSIDVFKKRYLDKDINKVVGIEARGFIFGALIAYELKLPFVIVRKPNKLPPPVDKMEYELEYGKDAIEISKGSIEKGDKVLIVDDLVATGGTLKATIDLVEKHGGEVHELACVIDLPEVRVKDKLKDYPIFKLVDFEGG
ncbi:MAG: adenine phosphoribosyltransferase [archaeon]